MRIAVFHNLPPGGAKRVLYEQLKFLSQENQIDLFQLTSTDNQFLDVRPFCKNIYTFSDPKPSSGFLKRLKEDIHIFWKIKNTQKKISDQINKENYDVVLVHPDSYTQAPYLLRFLKTPSVYFCEEWLRIVYEKEFEFHENVSLPKKIFETWSRKIKKRADYINTQAASKIVCNSNFTKGNIKQAYNRDALVNHLGVDTKVFKPSSKKRNQILFVGEPEEINGFNLLEEAYALLTSKNKPELKVMKASKIKSFSDTVLSQEYSKSKITVCLSRNEPFGFSVIESMACGTPVVALNEGGYKETVTNGKTGYLVQDNAKELASKIDLLLNPTTNKLFSERVLREAISTWGWSRHNKELTAILRKVSTKHEQN